MWHTRTHTLANMIWVSHTFSAPDLHKLHALNMKNLNLTHRTPCHLKISTHTQAVESDWVNAAGWEHCGNVTLQNTTRQMQHEITAVADREVESPNQCTIHVIAAVFTDCGETCVHVEQVE